MYLCIYHCLSVTVYMPVCDCVYVSLSFYKSGSCVRFCVYLCVPVDMFVCVCANVLHVSVYLCMSSFSVSVYMPLCFSVSVYM